MLVVQHLRNSWDDMQNSATEYTSSSINWNIASPTPSIALCPSPIHNASSIQFWAGFLEKVDPLTVKWDFILFVFVWHSDTHTSSASALVDARWDLSEGPRYPSSHTYAPLSSHKIISPLEGSKEILKRKIIHEYFAISQLETAADSFRPESVFWRWSSGSADNDRARKVSDDSVMTKILFKNVSACNLCSYCFVSMKNDKRSAERAAR